MKGDEKGRKMSNFGFCQCSRHLSVLPPTPIRQVDEFLEECVDPILEKHQALLQEKNVDDVNV